MNSTKWGLLAFALTFMLLLNRPLQAADAPPPAPQPAPAPPAKDAPAKTDDKAPKFANPIPGQCPVTDEPIDETVTADYKGKTYAFCCNSCRKKFVKNPEQYLTKK